MKTPRLIGGIGPESTIEYYRQIIAPYRAKRLDGSSPSIIINSIDLMKMMGLLAASRLPEVIEYLSVEIGRLAGAGDDFGALAANTLHVRLMEFHS